ncbi:MAG: DUF1667 domain-containing protein [Anaerolineae bacterium]|nr:DUF1667 domain-containing protein [Anaerolineae bacterium]
MSAGEETKEIICTACPRGCPLQVRVLREAVQVEGASCRRGVAFGRTEALDPRRVLTTTVRVRGGAVPVVPVRTRSPISRGLVPGVLAELRRVELLAPVSLHQIVLADPADAGTDVVTAASVEEVS